MSQQEPTDRVSAVALSHSARDMTPTVVAKGYGVVAESIIRVALDNGLYVHSSPDLVKLLMDVNLDARIPPQLYVAVAEVLAWLHKIENGQATKDYIKDLNRLNQSAP